MNLGLIFDPQVKNGLLLLNSDLEHNIDALIFPISITAMSTSLTLEATQFKLSVDLTHNSYFSLTTLAACKVCFN